MTNYQTIIDALIAEHVRNELDEEAALRKAEEEARKHIADVVIPAALKRFVSIGVLTIEEIEALFKGGEVSCYGTVIFTSPRIPFFTAEVLSTIDAEVRFQARVDFATRTFSASRKEHRSAVLALVADAYRTASETARRAEFVERMRSQS